MPRHSVVGLALAAVLTFVAAENARAQTASSFDSLGFLLNDSYFSYAYGLSADGRVVVGLSGSDGNLHHAFRWEGGAMTDLGTLGGNDWVLGLSSVAFGVSDDGKVVVGSSQTTTSSLYHAFRWEGGAMTDLGALVGHDRSEARSASVDGKVVVGISNDGTQYRAFRWVYDGASGSSLGVMTDLGTLGGSLSWAYGVSADGNVVAGSAQNNDNLFHAFRWVYDGTSGSSLGVMTDLGTLGGSSSWAWAVSADGSVVVGEASNGNQSHAFRWVSGATTGVPGNPQMHDLGTLPGGDSSTAYAVSAYGNVVVGSATIASYTYRAFRWTESTGMQSVQDLLSEAGVDMTGWTLYEARGVSTYGDVIAGRGYSPDNKDEAWIARLSGVPGIITPEEAARSFASLGALGRTGNAALGTTLSTMSQYATQGMDNNACGQSCPRYSVFAVAGYDSDPSGFGKLGMTMRLDEEGLVGGALIGADYIRTDMYADGEATMRGGSAGLFVARAPEAGLQWLVGLSGLTISGDVDRGYHNGNTPTTSRGNTTGNGYGIEARAGWTFDQLVSKTKITPFASYTFSSIRYDGYTESGGPFPASFAAFTDEMQTTRLGMDARYTLAPGQWVWGTLAWGHRFKGDGPEISGQLIGLFGMNVPGLTTDADWLEATAGLRMPVSASAAFTASASVTVPEHQQESYVFRAGLSQAF